MTSGVDQLNHLMVLLTVMLVTGTVAVPHRLHRRWGERPVNYGPAQAEGMSLHDALAEETHMTYTDFYERLTCVKDPVFHACFIVHLDPRFSLSVEEKTRLVQTKEPQQIWTAIDLEDFANKAGPNLATMCRKENIYWLTPDPRNPLPFPPDLDVHTHIDIQDYASEGSEQNVTPLSRPVAIPRSEARAPPQVLAPPRIRAPPPVSEYKALLAARAQAQGINQPQEDTETSPGSQSNILKQSDTRHTPPTLFRGDHPSRNPAPSLVKQASPVLEKADMHKLVRPLTSQQYKAPPVPQNRISS